MPSLRGAGAGEPLDDPCCFMVCVPRETELSSAARIISGGDRRCRESWIVGDMDVAMRSEALHALVWHQRAGVEHG